MTQFKFFKILFLFCLLLPQTNALAKNKNGKEKKTQESFCLKVDLFLFPSRQLLTFAENHPLLSTATAMSAVWFLLHPDQVKNIKKTIYDHPDISFAAVVATVATCYAKRKSIVNYLTHDPSDDEDKNESENEEPENNYEKFSKSGVTIYEPSEIKTKFSDVAGLESAKEDLADILCFLKNPKKFEAIGAHVPKGVLLSGAPGNGKTLLARAVAGEAECPFLHINASQINEAFVGVGASRIRDLFAVARELAPCIIFMDEIDAIGSKRRSSGSVADSDSTQTLNQLLSEMDGFEQEENPIIVIGATNRANVLDEALMRPGRFDRTVHIHAPYIKDRCEILKIHLAKVKTTKDINIEKIACGTAHFSSAQLANLINEAAILAIRAGKSAISMEDIDQARDSIILGRETKGMDASEADFWNTAIHESGHALARVFQSKATPLYKVTITPRGQALGLTFGMSRKEYYSQTEEELRAEIVVSLAGSVAEEIIFNHRGVGARSDLSKAREIATAMVMHYGMTQEFKDVTFAEFIDNQVHLPDQIATKLHEEIGKIINECRAIAIKIITDHKIELIKLSEMLMNQKTVSGGQVYKLCGIEEPELQFSMNE